MLCEGAAADWAAVFLHNSLHTAAAIAGLGYAVYCLAMVAVRLSGNRLLARFTAQRMLPALSGIATAGFATGLAVDSTVSMLIGFACLGAGVASVIPAVFSAAGRVRGINAGSAVAIVSACGWAGFVCGPPLIGQLAAASLLAGGAGPAAGAHRADRRVNRYGKGHSRRQDRRAATSRRALGPGRSLRISPEIGEFADAPAPAGLPS
jgi:hypothetical protein